MTGISDGEATLAALHSSILRFAAIRALIDIDVPEQLREGPLSVTELASRCGAHAPALGRLLRSVAATGLLRTVSPGTYELTEAGQALVTGAELPFVLWNTDPEAWRALGELTETVRTGQPPILLRYPSLYHYLASHPGSSEVFHALMVSKHTPLADRLPYTDALDGVRTVVDVGGGKGTFIAAILRAHPGARGILLDIERALPAAKEYLAACGVADRCELVAGDFFASVPAGADAYVLAHVMHNWDDPEAIAILRSVRDAMPPHGRVLIVEDPVPDDDLPHPVKDLDVRMLSFFGGGGERTPAEYASLLTEAGLRPGPVTELAPGGSVITGSLDA